MAKRKATQMEGGCVSGCISCSFYALIITVIAILVIAGLPGIIALAILITVIGFFVIVGMQLISTITKG